jgi:hypothetical protein
VSIAAAYASSVIVTVACPPLDTIGTCSSHIVDAVRSCASCESSGQVTEFICPSHSAFGFAHVLFIIVNLAVCAGASDGSMLSAFAIVSTTVPAARAFVIWKQLQEQLPYSAWLMLPHSHRHRHMCKQATGLGPRQHMRTADVVVRMLGRRRLDAIREPSNHVVALYSVT